MAQLDTTMFQYNMDYFSGAQAAIYIGHILLDEVTTLEWTVNQAKIPLYGYASQYFDEMARGSVIIQGQFSINFIEPNYLFSVLSAIHNNQPETRVEQQDKVLMKKLSNILKTFSSDVRFGSKQDYRKVMKEFDERKSGARYFKLLNDAIWGPSREEKKQTSFGRVDDTEINGFDIKIDFESEDRSRPTSQQIISNVHILGSSRSLVIDEQPIQEVYSFYAQKMLNIPEQVQNVLADDISF